MNIKIIHTDNELHENSFSIKIYKSPKDGQVCGLYTYGHITGEKTVEWISSGYGIAVQDAIEQAKIHCEQIGQDNLFIYDPDQLMDR